MAGLLMYMIAHTGEDLLPKVREMVKEKGFLPQDAEQRDQSWLDTYGMVQTIMVRFPGVSSKYIRSVLPVSRL